MTERDEYDEQAEELLPCNCSSRIPFDFDLNKHLPSCQVWSRPAVAAALRKRDEVATQQIEDVARRMGDDLIEVKAQLTLANIKIARLASALDDIRTRDDARRGL